MGHCHTLLSLNKNLLLLGWNNKYLDFHINYLLDTRKHIPQTSKFPRSKVNISNIFFFTWPSCAGAWRKSFQYFGKPAGTSSFDHVLVASSKISAYAKLSPLVLKPIGFKIFRKKYSKRCFTEFIETCDNHRSKWFYRSLGHEPSLPPNDSHLLWYRTLEEYSLKSIYNFSFFQIPINISIKIMWKKLPTVNNSCRVSRSDHHFVMPNICTGRVGIMSDSIV